MTYNRNYITDILRPVFMNYNVNKAVLFGSASRSETTGKSDIDIAVDSGLKGLAFFGLLEEVCSHFDCRVDLIDTQDIIPDSLIDKEIRNTGVTIYERA
ncbi:MAG: nucleotidyltransferase family protein [Ruminiclostridium sp.]